MDKTSLDFVLSVLPEGRRVFYDFADRYALLLLGPALADGRRTIADLKNSQFAPLLEKPVVKELISELGRPWLADGDLLNAWPEKVDAYRLTLDSWPARTEKPRREWHQVTRQGWSLVLQLNFPVSHRRELSKTVEDWKYLASYSFHPVATPPDELTLAWSRVDLDFSNNEALIEEIQSDWVRDVKFYAEASWVHNQEAWKAYSDNYLAPIAKTWPQTMLTATLWFLWKNWESRRFFFTHMIQAAS